MSEETKQRAYEKLETFRPKIGYPEKFRDYSALEVRADDLLGNVAAASSFETDRQLRKIGSPVDRDEWFMLPQTVNAYYNPGTNEICFPAGILQKPFFSPDADAAENYGGIGAVIGHEIGHGFDDQGAQYDGAGNLNDWWSADDKAAFEVKSKALIEQYDAFEPRALPGEHVNGALTVGENIGDLGGLTIGHKAYVISRDGEARRGVPAQAVHELGLLLADQAPQRAGAAVPHHRPAQPAGVPRQHRAQPRRVPRGLRDRRGRRPVAGPRTSASGSGDHDGAGLMIEVATSGQTSRAAWSWATTARRPPPRRRAGRPGSPSASACRCTSSAPGLCPPRRDRRPPRAATCRR